MIARETPDRLPAFRLPPAALPPAKCGLDPAAPWWRDEEAIERRLTHGIEALEYFADLPVETAARIVRELADYFAGSLGRILADSADYLAAISERDRELHALARAAFPKAADRLRLARALRELTRTR